MRDETEGAGDDMTRWNCVFSRFCMVRRDEARRELDHGVEVDSRITSRARIYRRTTVFDPVFVGRSGLEFDWTFNSKLKSTPTPS